MNDMTDEAVKALLEGVEFGPRDLLNKAAPDLARALLEARAENAHLRAASDAFRMCVNCGLIVPASHDRAQPGPGCDAPDACTFDLSPREAWGHWRAKAHQYRADAQAAVALVVEKAAGALSFTQWSPYTSGSPENAAWVKGATDTVKAAEVSIRALADTDGLAMVEALRKERDEFWAVSETLSAMHQGAEDRAERLTADLAAAQAQIKALKEAIGYYEIGCTAVGVPHNGERKILHDCVAKARAIRAALPAKEGE